PVNTMCPAEDYAWVLADSRARGAVVSASRMPDFLDAARIAGWQGRIIVSGGAGGGFPALEQLFDAGSPNSGPAGTRPDDHCFWLYSSGSTGRPKGVIHIQTSLVETAELFARGVLGITDADIVYSSAKLFFAYGLGNSLTFPLASGATCILNSARV